MTQSAYHHRQHHHHHRRQMSHDIEDDDEAGSDLYVNQRDLQVRILLLQCDPPISHQI